MRKKILKFLSVAATLIFITAWALNSFSQTMTDKRLQEDILNNLIIVDSQTQKSLRPQILAQKVLQVKTDESSGQWKEIWEEWELKWGEQQRTMIIKLTPASDGGVDFFIYPKEIAQSQGLLKELEEN
ncbi:MAG: hypothetical protein PHQ96_05480 [Candidatus Omnitrophica bacterium]|nr:hypothetical protein [Candidatus Omnitrophota bacterium]